MAAIGAMVSPIVRGAAALVCASHTPLLDRNETAADTRARVDAAFASARDFIASYAPDLVVLFGPDHYNGVFYDLMPPFCIGAAAEALGDYDFPTGPLSVDRDAARALARGVLAADIDVAYSEALYVDHGFSQPLQLLFGGLNQVPVVPVFINSVAEPLNRPRRARLLGEAIGVAAAGLGRRVLYLGSGGLSHDPPVPRIDEAPPELVARLVSEGRRLTPAQRAERERRAIQAGLDLAAGVATIAPLNPEWDRAVLEVFASGRLDEVDTWTTEWFVEQAGHSSHEVRTWIAAHAALAATGPYETISTFYEAVPEWITGFAVVHARSLAPTLEDRRDR
jgi:2,3-dihydroxyphenylpropionate 1,2-dioxygenase